MKPVYNILVRVFIRPFYRENAALFLFIIIMMFLIVNRVDGADVFRYHYSLIRGMLKSPVFLGCVFVIWLLYCRKCLAFFCHTQRNPENNFLELLNKRTGYQRRRAYLLVAVLFAMPALLYALLVIIIGLIQQYYWSTAATAVFWCMMIIVMTAIMMRQADPLVDRSAGLTFVKITLPVSYPVVLLRYIQRQSLILLLGIKLVTCLLLLLVVSNNIITDADIAPVYLLYSFCVFANGIVLYRMRAFEAQHLGFYPSLPVGKIRRLLQYGFICLVCLLPEMIVVLTANASHFPALFKAGFLLCGYGVLLFMNSISFIRDFNFKEYLGLLLIVFALQFILLLISGLLFIGLIFVCAAVIIFLRSYNSFEKMSF